mmetsp:Transcript_46170/g.147507  ORF Transcript_46170/g.147507 Transcript_46170/m.147507 type:complete len:237 (-) Transcript_46170:95-805(-)
MLMLCFKHQGLFLVREGQPQTYTWATTPLTLLPTEVKTLIHSRFRGPARGPSRISPSVPVTEFAQQNQLHAPARAGAACRSGPSPWQQGDGIFGTAPALQGMPSASTFSSQASVRWTCRIEKVAAVAAIFFVLERWATRFGSAMEASTCLWPSERQTWSRPSAQRSIALSVPCSGQGIGSTFMLDTPLVPEELIDKLPADRSTSWIDFSSPEPGHPSGTRDSECGTPPRRASQRGG